MRIVTNDEFCFSTTSGSGIVGVIINCSRIMKTKSGRTKYLRTDVDGMNVDDVEIAHQIGLVRGYLKEFSRNNINFVMSRRARRHGMKTDHLLYNLRSRPK